MNPLFPLLHFNVDFKATSGKQIATPILADKTDPKKNTMSSQKLFADDTSLFKVVYDEQVSSSVLHNDLKTIKSWSFQWKMQFNPDPNIQAVQMVFSRKRTKPYHPQIFFNDTAANQLPKHTHILG